MSSRQQRPGDQMGQNDDDPPSPDMLTTFEDIEDELTDHEQLPGFRIFPDLISIGLPAFRNRADNHEYLHSQQSTTLTNSSESMTHWQRENHEVSSDTRHSHLMARPRVLETDQVITARSSLNNTMLPDTYLPDTRNQETQTEMFDEIANNENLSGNQILCNINSSESHPNESTSEENSSLCQSPLHTSSAAEQNTDSLNFLSRAEEISSGQSAGTSFSITSENEDYSTILDEINAYPDAHRNKASSESNCSDNSITDCASSPTSYFEQFQLSQEPTLTPHSSKETESSSDGGSSNLPQQSRGNNFESYNSRILLTHPTNDVLTMDRSLPSLTTATVMDNMPFENKPSKNRRMSNCQPQTWPATDAASSLIPSSTTSIETIDVASDHQNDMLNYNARKRPVTHAPHVDSLTSLEEDPDFDDDSQVQPHKKARTTDDPSAESLQSNSKT